ncbi:MAG: hypothetical protein ACREP9_18150, partial [Candidatus Dormibacteraceae bacterium]
LSPHGRQPTSATLLFMPDHTSEDPTALDALFQSWVLAAFRQARASGRPDWYLMLAGVLKNRILQLSSREFREESFNEEHFLGVLAHYPHLISVESSHRPPLVELAPEFRRSVEDDVSTRQVTHTAGRIRRDLWDAVLDYRRNETWVWDEDAKVAMPIPDPSASSLRMPTVDDEKVRRWREEFATIVAENFSTTSQDELADWINNGRAILLPPYLKRDWSSFIKSKVRAQISDWAKTNGIFLADLYEGIAPTARESEVVQLRALLTRAINSMSLEELHQLQIPITVVLRIKT